MLSVFCSRLIAVDTIDEYITEVQQKKSEWMI